MFAKSSSLKNVFFAALSTISDYVAADGSLLQGAIVQDAEQLAPRFLDLVFGAPQLQAAFAVQHGAHLVLDKAKLLKFLTSKDFLPDSFTAFSNKIGLTSEGRFISYNRDVVLDFPYKDAVLVGNQSREEQAGVAEKFYNEVLAADEIDRLFEPKALSNFVRHQVAGAASMPAEDALDVEQDNLVIRGNNLLVLHSLQARYAGQVKLIYIDVPYNTGSDSFAYNDKFNHSTWLTFMKNRLEAAKPLLARDGFFVMQADCNEIHYLKVLCDEVLGRDKFMAMVAVRMSNESGPKMAHKHTRIPKIAEYLLVYAMTPGTRITPATMQKSAWDSEYKYVLTPFTMQQAEKVGNVATAADVSAFNQELVATRLVSLTSFWEQQSISFTDEADKKAWLLDNSWRIYRDSPASAIKKLADSKAWSQQVALLLSAEGIPSLIRTDYNKSAASPRVQLVQFSPYVTLGDMWTDFSTTGLHAEGGVVLKNGKKPEALLHRLLSMFTRPSDRVLDFFLGSGTTAAVAHKMGRKYIGIEQMDYGTNSAEARLAKVIAGEQSGISAMSSVAWAGGGSFVSASLYGRVDDFKGQVMEATSTTIDSVVDALSDYSMYLDYRFRPEVLASPEFAALSLEQKKTILMQALDKNNLYANYSDIEDAELALSEADKALNHKFYGGK